MPKSRPRVKNRDNSRRSKKKVSFLTHQRVEYIDYKDVELLRRFMSDRAKIRARRVTGNDAQQQRTVARAIKNAREMALLSYANRITTQRGAGRSGPGRGADGGPPGRRPEAPPTPPPPPPDGRPPGEAAADESPPVAATAAGPAAGTDAAEPPGDVESAVAAAESAPSPSAAPPGDVESAASTAVESAATVESADSEPGEAGV